MRKTINCFIPYEENTAIDKVVTALKDSIVVNKIYLLTTAHGSMPSVPAGCEPFTIDSLNSSDTIKKIAQKADTPFTLLYTKASPFELGYMALERIADFLQDRKTGKREKRKSIPPLITNREVYAMTSTSGLCWHSEANT